MNVIKIAVNEKTESWNSTKVKSLISKKIWSWKKYISDRCSKMQKCPL